MKKYLIRYSVHFYYYSFEGNRKKDTRSGEYEVESPSMEEAARQFKDLFYANKESYFVALPEFGWKLTHLEVDKIWELPANLGKILNEIWVYYDNLLKQVGKGPFGGMDINRS